MTSEFIRVMDSNVNTNWKIRIDGFFKLQVEKQLLNDDITQESVDKIFENATQILSKCPNPNINKDVSQTGILIGKVQSGKTSNFISLASLAFDNGYEIVIILGGNTLQLLQQNAKRISDAFNVNSEKLTVLKTDNNKMLINSDIIKEFIENKRKIIIVGLKHYKHISQISKIFDNSFLSEKPVLIIDDEGDQATLNTKAFIDSMSSTYESVIELKSKLKTHCFLSITATPQANIFIKVLDKLSPDFGELVYPGKGYCGLQEFHGENRDKFIYEIPSNENNLIDDVGVPDSLYKALSMFVVGNAIRRSRNDFRNHAMLIHPSQKKFDQKQVVGKIQGILDNWKTIAKLKTSNSVDISYSILRDNLLDAYSSFNETCENLISFDNIENIILDIIKQCSPVHICNSDQNASENSNLYSTNIFVGGNLVERGITIKGLAITYITRRSKGKSNVDNTEQRARWFGYKADYMDVCRVFATRDIKDDFTSILDHDEDMWATIERAKERGLTFKEMPRVFKLARQTYLNLTRLNVAKHEPFTLSEWKSQKYIELNKFKSEQNDLIIKHFRNINNNELEKHIINQNDFHMILKNKKYNQIYQDILSKLNYPENEVLNDKYFRNLDEVFNKSGFQPSVDLVWIRDEKKSRRKIESGNEVQQLFQGRNPDISSKNYYEGDRSFARISLTNIQIQIHYVKPSNIVDIDFYSPVLAIYIPESCSSKILEYVVSKND